MQKIKKSKIYLSAAVFMLILMILAAPLNITTKAAAYKGSGTMASPYIVETAEQLQDMRDNLSAHYKLGNTIDLSGVDFKPIGRLDTPFTGSFICELNSDNTPKYIIKNLKMDIAETAFVAEGKSKWEGGLFGATDGATISGIYVLDASVTNQVFGGNTGSVAYNDYKPGMNEMATGILIGTSTNTIVSNCGTSGVTGGRGSRCGGLIGCAIKTTVENCYSTATVTTEGLWSVGGLIGNSQECTVMSSFSEGNVTGGANSTSSFIGTTVNGTTIKDCYSKGNAKTIGNASPFFSVTTGSAVVTNCIAYGTGCGDEYQPSSKDTVQNCWSTNSTITGFTKSDIASIKSAFSGQSAWDVSGSEPVLKNIGIVTDASQYVPGATEQVADSSAGSSAATESTADSSATTQTVLSSDELAKLIEALPDPDVEGSITLEDKDAIKEAYLDYEALSVGEKEDFDATLAAKLIKARYKVSLLMVSDLVTAIEELPEDESEIIEMADEIIALYEDYLFIDDEIKAEIDEDKIEKLEKAYEIAKNAGESSDSAAVAVDNSLTGLEWFIVIFGSIIIVLALAFDIFAGCWFIKHRTTKNGTDSGDEFGEE